MKTVVLHTPAQGIEAFRLLWAWAKDQLQHGKPITVQAKHQRRTLDQNAHIHPVVERIATATGRPTDKESLRRLRYLLLEAWRHETHRSPLFERSLDGLRWVNVDTGTSDLDKPDCSEFIEWMLAFEAVGS